MDEIFDTDNLELKPNIADIGIDINEMINKFKKMIMEIIDINSLDQGAVYMMYDMFKSMKENLEKKDEFSDEETQKLQHLKAQLQHIENWANLKLNEELHWTKEEILSNYGHKATLIINFHPSTKAYAKYGKEIVANIEFSEGELLHMFTNIQNKTDRKSGIVTFKLIPDNIDGVFETSEIFEIVGRRI